MAEAILMPQLKPSQIGTLMLLATSQATADPLIVPTSTKQAVDWGLWLFELIAVVFIGKLLFVAAIAFFVLLHVALLALLIVGCIKRRYWRRGIQLCLICLAVLYSALFYVIHQSEQGTPSQASSSMRSSPTSVANLNNEPIATHIAV